MPNRTANMGFGSAMGSAGLVSGQGVMGTPASIWPVQTDRPRRNFEAEKFFNLGNFCCPHCGEYSEPWEACENFLCKSNSALVKMEQEIENLRMTQQIEAIRQSGGVGTINISNRSLNVRDTSGITRAVIGDLSTVRVRAADLTIVDEADDLLASYEDHAVAMEEDTEVPEDRDERTTVNGWSLNDMASISRMVRSTRELNQQFETWTRHVTGQGNITWSNSTH